MTGSLACNICEAKYQTQINSLTEPIDIFTEWLDEATETQASVMASNRRGHVAGSEDVGAHNDE
jgi:transcription elongation factor Elf1